MKNRILAVLIGFFSVVGFAVAQYGGYYGFPKTFNFDSLTVTGLTVATRAANVYTDTQQITRGNASAQNEHLRLQTDDYGTNTPYLYFKPVSAGTWQIGLWDGTDQDGTIDFAANTGMTVNSNTVWHSGNDGGGSGLAADTTDGHSLHYCFVSYDFGSIAAGAKTSVNQTCSGLSVTGPVACFVDGQATYTGLVFTCTPQAVNSVTVYAQNVTTGAIDPTSLNFELGFIWQN